MTKSLVVLLCLLLSSTSSHAYFNRIMGCQEFCKMLSQSEVRQFYCMLDICRGRDLRSHVMSFAKRGQGYDEAMPRLWNVLSGNSPGSKVDMEKRDAKYWEKNNELVPSDWQSR